MAESYLTAAELLAYVRTQRPYMETVPYTLVLPLLGDQWLVDAACAYTIARVVNLFWDIEDDLAAKLVSQRAVGYSVINKYTDRCRPPSSVRDLISTLAPTTLALAGFKKDYYGSPYAIEITVPVLHSRDPMELARWYVAWGESRLLGPSESS